MYTRDVFVHARTIPDKEIGDTRDCKVIPCTKETNPSTKETYSSTKKPSVYTQETHHYTRTPNQTKGFSIRDTTKASIYNRDISIFKRAPMHRGYKRALTVYKRDVILHTTPDKRALTVYKRDLVFYTIPDKRALTVHKRDVVLHTIPDKRLGHPRHYTPYQTKEP